MDHTGIPYRLHRPDDNCTDTQEDKGEKRYILTAAVPRPAEVTDDAVMEAKRAAAITAPNSLSGFSQVLMPDISKRAVTTTAPVDS